ncbi:MAG: hypothetical protein IT563_19540 [Alphaproteobacteria bacterium]|nr:hypothetical protein [Alphaproteobacteria bacterium]
MAAACAGGTWPALKAGPPGSSAEASTLSNLAANPPQPDVPQVATPAAPATPAQVMVAQAAPQPAPQPQASPYPPTGAAPAAAPAASPATTPGAPTGTYVGQKVGQLRGELVRLQGLISSHNAELQQNRADMIQQSRLYHQIVASINSRLQVGTTPGNPELIAQWNQAQGEIDKLDGAIAKLSRLTNATAGDASMATYLLDSTRAAYSLSGAVDEDHRQLAILEDEINRTVVLIERLLNELSEDLQRQNNYLAGERRNLQLLSVAVKNGELYGPSLYNRPFVSMGPTPTQMAAAGSPAPQPQPPGNRRPLVVVKFDRPNVEYEQQLYAAVSQALDRKPDAMFDLVAVSPAKPGPGPSSGAAARRNAEHVMRSLTNMGLPPARVTLSATNSAQIQANEVHLYVR